MRLVIFIFILGIAPLLPMDPKQTKSEQRIALKFLVQSGKRPVDCMHAL